MKKNKRGSLEGWTIFGVLAIVVIATGILGTVLWQAGVFEPSAQEIITVDQKVPATYSACIQNAKDAGRLGRGSTTKAIAYDGAATDVNTKRASTLYMWNENDPNTIVVDGTTLSASDYTAITGFNWGDVVEGVSFDSTYAIGIPSVATCVDSDTIIMDFRIFRSTDAIKITFKGNETEGQAVTMFHAEVTSNEIDELIFHQNQSGDAYRFAGFHFDTVASSNVTSITVGGVATYSVADSVQRANAGLDATMSSVSVTSLSASPFGATTRREIDDYVFTVTPTIMLENDKIKVKNLFFKVDATNKCGTAETITVYSVDQGHSRSQAGNGIVYGYETDATTPLDAGIDDDAGGSFSGTLSCEAS